MKLRRSLTPPSGFGRSADCLKSTFLFFFILFAAAPRLPARPTSAAEARQAVQTWLAQEARPLGAALSHAIAGTAAYQDSSGADAFYIVSLAPEGFVVVAADDLVEPIVLFSTYGHYDNAKPNPMRRLVGRDLPERVGHVRARQKVAQGKGQALALTAEEDRARRKWSRLAQPAAALAPSSGKISTVSEMRIAPLVLSRWDQETVGNNLACYNYYTPPGPAGAASNYPCGCVATAMAQIMRYYSFPNSGVGTASYSITVNSNPQNQKLRGGDGSGGAYAWWNMPLVPTGSITTTQRQAIGALTHDASVSVNMDFAQAGSASYVSDAATQLVTAFHYANAVYGYSRTSSSIPSAALYRMINPNLDAGYPVLLGIMGSGYTGHAIVCDGYGFNTTTSYHHLNMGWSGYDDAWYNLPNIDAATFPFNVVDECIYNIYVSGAGEIISGRVTGLAGEPLAGAKVTAQRVGGGTYSAVTNTSGIYALAKIPANSQYALTIQQPGLVFSPQTATTGLSQDTRSSSGNLWAVDFSAKKKNAARDWDMYH